MNVFLVFMPEGQLFECTFEYERAKQAARNIGGAVGIIPAILDYRDGKMTGYQYPDFAVVGGKVMGE